MRPDLEYWWYILVYVCLCFAAGFIDGFISGFMRGFNGSNSGNPGIVLGLVQLLHILPSLSVFVRRLHDTDRSGWWYFAAFTIVGLIPLFVFSVSRGTIGSNRFGSDPLGQTASLRDEGFGASSMAVDGIAPRFDAIKEIERLSSLKAAGHLNDAEFAAMKSQVFGRA
ncbi:uncharacterized membrane protein YhaH (DUF805 family) [Methylobacterium sp. OAE515]|uniref:DUF805 domain-containing protein n=1 Tax=Methylobacterium sp. OAE515 TaxID=2817895 RepID=UPI00359D6FC3